MIEAAIVAHIKAAAAVAALVGDRIYPAPLPQAETMPAVTWQRISRVTPVTHDRKTGPSLLRIQIDTWALTRDSARAVADAVEAAIFPYRGLMGTADIQSVFLDGDQDLTEPDVNPEEPDLHRVRRDYRITHKDE